MNEAESMSQEVYAAEESVRSSQYFDQFRDRINDYRDGRGHYLDEGQDQEADSDEGDPFQGNDELQIKLQAIADSRQRQEMEDGQGDVNQHDAESRQGYNQQQSEAQQLTAFFKPSRESQDQRIKEYASIENDSKVQTLRQAYDDHQATMTFTQNSMTQGIGREYLAQTNLSGLEDHKSGEDIIDQLLQNDHMRIEQDQPLYGMPSSQKNTVNSRDVVSPRQLSEVVEVTGKQRRTKSRRNKDASPEIRIIKDELTQEQFHEVYVFVDQVPISKVKRNLNRDFADGCLAAEVIHNYLPQSHKGLCQVHNYVSTNQLKKKRANWQLLNRKVLQKLGRRAGFSLSDEQIEGIITAKYGYVEKVLLQIKNALRIFMEQPTPIPDIAKSTFRPAGDYPNSSHQKSHSRSRTSFHIDFVQQNISNLHNESSRQRSVSGAISPLGLSSRGNSRRLMSSQASQNMDRSRARAEPLTMLSTARRVEYRKRKKNLKPTRTKFDLRSSPPPLNIHIENQLANKKNPSKELQKTTQPYQTQRLKQSHSDFQLDKFNNTLNVMSSQMYPTPQGSPMISSQEGLEKIKHEQNRRKSKNRNSTLSVHEKQRNNKSFTAALKSIQLGQTGQSSSLINSLQTPLLQSQRDNLRQFRDYQNEYKKNKKRQDSEQKQQSLMHQSESQTTQHKRVQSKHSTEIKVVAMQVDPMAKGFVDGNAPIEPQDTSSKRKYPKTYGSMIHQRQQANLDFEVDQKNKNQEEIQIKDTPGNHNISVNSVPQVQNISTHSFNPQGATNHSPPSIQIHQDSNQVNDQFNKPKSPSFRKQAPDDQMIQNMYTSQRQNNDHLMQNNQYDGQNSSPPLSQQQQTSKAQSFKPMGSAHNMHGRDSHSLNRPDTNPSFNNYSNADAQFQLNESNYLQQAVQSDVPEIVTGQPSDYSRRQSKEQNVKFSAKGNSIVNPNNGSIYIQENEILRRENEDLLRKISTMEASSVAQNDKIEQMQKTMDIMRERIEKMNMLIEVKDQKIENLKKALHEVEVDGGGTGGEGAKIDFDYPNMDPIRKGRNTPALVTPSVSNQNENQNIKNGSAMSSNFQITNSALYYGNQMNQGGPGGAVNAISPIQLPQPFTPIMSNNGEEDMGNNGQNEQDMSNDIAALFQQNSQINLVTNSNNQSRQRGGGRIPSQQASDTMNSQSQQIHQPTVQYVNAQLDSQHEDRDHRNNNQPPMGDNFSPNFMTMDEYKSGKKSRRQSYSRKQPGRMSQQQLSDRQKGGRNNQKNVFGQNKQSFGEQMPDAPNTNSLMHAQSQSQAQGQGYQPSIDTAGLDDVEDLRKHFRSIKSDQVMKPMASNNTPPPHTHMPAKRKGQVINRPKGRNNNNHTTIHSRENTSDLMEQKIPYYLRRDQKFFSMKEL